jgi:hypothetical protein
MYVTEVEDDPMAVSIGLDGPEMNAAQGGSKGRKEKKK